MGCNIHAVAMASYDGGMERYDSGVQAALARLESKVDHILEQVRKINGRVNGLENWKQNQEVAQARMEGRSEAFITKAQLAILATVISMASTVIGILSRYFL